MSVLKSVSTDLFTYIGGNSQKYEERKHLNSERARRAGIPLNHHLSPLVFLHTSGLKIMIPVTEKRVTLVIQVIMLKLKGHMFDPVLVKSSCKQT